jgi:1,4-alpha-glucan branching enzyme
MPGDPWQKFANLRLYLTFMYAHPGKKLLFMGCEFAQYDEWNHDDSLDWHLLGDQKHQGIKCLVQDLNALYREQSALSVFDTKPEGFSWIECHDQERTVLAFRRHGEDAADDLFVVCNLTPMVRTDYRLGVPYGGGYSEVFNSDAACYGGSTVNATGTVMCEDVPMHGQARSLALTLPSLSVIILRPNHN